jgi:hypothetical protein
VVVYALAVIEEDPVPVALATPSIGLVSANPDNSTAMTPVYSDI